MSRKGALKPTSVTGCLLASVRQEQRKQPRAAGAHPERGQLGPLPISRSTDQQQVLTWRGVWVGISPASPPLLPRSPLHLHHFSSVSSAFPCFSPASPHTPRSILFLPSLSCAPSFIYRPVLFFLGSHGIFKKNKLS